MARKSDNPIPNMSTDWGHDPSIGLPFSGQSVQNFIKLMLNTKATTGSFVQEEMTLYLFKDELDKAAFDEDMEAHRNLAVGVIPLNFGSVQKRIKVTPDGSKTINASLNQETIPLSMSLRVESKDISESEWETTGQDIIANVYLDADSTGNYRKIDQLSDIKVLSSEGRLSVDIKPYIRVGTSRVRIMFSVDGEESVTASIVYTVTLAEMYIEPWESTWNKAIIEGDSTDNYGIGGFRIVGTLVKTLHITLSTANSIVAYYSYPIGTTEATSRPFVFLRSNGLDLSSPMDENGNSLPALTTGVYNVRAWLTSGELSTQDNAVSYSVMYVASGEQYSAKLVVMNNSGRIVNNYDESAHLCDYAIYNAGSSTGVVNITITPYDAANPLTPYNSDPLTVETGKIKDLNHNISLVTTSSNLSVRYRVTLTGGNYQEDTSVVDNTEIFEAAPGASFYLNPSLRSNDDTANRTTVYNTANNNTVALQDIEWTKMSWVDEIDGWTTDDQGRHCLFLPARSKLTIPASSFWFLTGNSFAIELCYRVKNVSDYSENVISIAENPTLANFKGVRIKPTNITVHSSADTTAGNDTYRGTNLEDEETVHLLISAQSGFNGRSGKNLVTGYVNGTKGFQFALEGDAGFATANSAAIFGSETADLYLYMMRFYPMGLSSADAEKNWLNAMANRDDKVLNKAFINSVLSSTASATRGISYEDIKDGERYNFFVVEMTEGAGIPSMSYPSGGKANVEMHYGKDANGNSRSSWDWKIYDVETKGQGTTSMHYWLWNIRWRIDKTDSSGKRMIAYYDTPSVDGKKRIFNELPASSSKTVWFDGENNHPAVKRITAKINFASSMQSHKMGATRAYSVLHDEIESGALLNEAQIQAASDSLPHPEVAVYQYPAFGFKKTGNTYEFIGLFTIGPDKGDKPTFGWNLADEEDLVTLEGTDHFPQLAKFNVPWDEQVVYTLNEKEDGFLSVKTRSSVEPAFEVGNAGSANTKVPTSALPVVKSAFFDAYSVIYDNSTLIMPVALDDSDFGGENAAAVLANINGNVDAFQGRKYAYEYSGNNQRIALSDVEFWIQGEYKLYHFEQESGSYVSGYKTSGSYGSGLDLRTDTGISDAQLVEKTLSEQNDMFKQARRERFIANAGTYWDLKELVFNYVFLVVFGATDNFAKNQYPYCLGGKWRLRQDDLDTILDIDNNGGQTKPADIEFYDSVSGAPYFNGSSSVLWNLVHEALWNDFTVDGITYSGIKTMGREMIELMSSKASGINAYDGFIKFFDKYFWSRAQTYFPPSAYNIDGGLKYEEAWLVGGEASDAVDPLRQSLGSHHSAERLWTRRRALYCMSLFGVGPFIDDDLSYLGRIQFRPDQIGEMTISFSESLYPCMFKGAGVANTGTRTLAGSSCTFTGLNNEGTSRYTIQAVDYITSLGDLRNLKLGYEDGGNFNLTGKRMRTFKLGDEDESKAKSDVRTLSIANGLPCLEVIDLRNISTLTGSLDLSDCKRVKEVYAEGTNLSSVILPRGSKIEILHLPENVTSISYQVIKYLNELVLPEDASGITLLYLQDCDRLNALETLQTIFNADGQSLQFIRLLWDSETNVTGSQIRAIARIMQNKEKDGSAHSGGYHGVNVSVNPPTGDSSNPYLEGRVIADAYYGSDITLLANGSTPSDSTDHPGMKQILASYFGPLHITYDPDDEYVEFVDSNVESVLADAFGDGEGIRYTEARSLTSFVASGQSNPVFYNDTSITSFDELEAFTGLLDTSNALRGCTNLESFVLPSNMTNIGNSMFEGCTALTSITIPQSVRNIGNDAFRGCTGLTSVPVFSNNLNSIGSNAFRECTSISGDVTIPAGVSSVGDGAFFGCSGVINVTCLNTTGTVAYGAFVNCGNSIGNLVVNCNLTRSGTTRAKFKSLVIRGNVTNTGGYGFVDGVPLEYAKIGGSFNSSAGWFHNSGNVACVFSFCEIMGDVVLTDSAALLYGTPYQACATGFIFHFGYNGVITARPYKVINGNDNRIYKIYVGDGSSLEHDNAILAQYQADTDWSAYSSKLDAWYNYINDPNANPDYIN